MLPMNSGVEAVETAVKLARRWGYVTKNIEDDKARIIATNGCFHGRSITMCKVSDDPIRYTKFGPFTPGFDLVPFNNVDAIRNQLEVSSNYCAVILEPIQGEGGVIVPTKGYL